MVALMSLSYFLVAPTGVPSPFMRRHSLDFIIGLVWRVTSDEAKFLRSWSWFEDDVRAWICSLAERFGDWKVDIVDRDLGDSMRRGQGT